MNTQESLQDKFSKLFNNITSISNKLVNTVKEELEETSKLKTSKLVCVQEGSLNFERIDEDVRRIDEEMKARGHRVLGSQLILDDKQDSMEIRTYTERDDKTFEISVDAEVKRVTNIPSDVLYELQQNGRIKLILGRSTISDQIEEDDEESLGQID